MMVSIDKLEVGMKVARDVVGPDLAVLLPAGVHLTTEHLRKLRATRVEGVHVVEGGAVGASPDVKISPEVEQAAEERVNERFKHVDGTEPSVDLVKKVAIKRVAVQLALTPPQEL
jgi:hypothetical protein